MKDLTELPLALIGAAVVFVGTLFQVGYFWSFGLEFMSTASVGDWLFHITVVGMSSIPFVVLGHEVAARLAKKIEASEEQSLRVDAYYALGVVILLAVAAGLSGWTGSTVPFWLALGLTTGVKSMIRLYRVIARKAAGKAILRGDVSWMVIGFAMTSIVAGKVFADSQVSGNVCVFTFNDGRTLSARYMRSVADGHLVKVGDERFYLSKATVSEIKCSGKGRI